LQQNLPISLNLLAKMNTAAIGPSGSAAYYVPFVVDGQWLI